METKVVFHTVVIALSSVIEEALVGAVCLAQDGHDIFLLQVGASDHGVGYCDVLGVMLVVVDAKSLLT